MLLQESDYVVLLLRQCFYVIVNLLVDIHRGQTGGGGCLVKPCTLHTERVRRLAAHPHSQRKGK